MFGKEVLQIESLNLIKYLATTQRFYHSQSVNDSSDKWSMSLWEAFNSR